LLTSSPVFFHNFPTPDHNYPAFLLPPKTHIIGVATAANAVATTLTAVKTIVLTTLQMPSQRLPQNPFFAFLWGGGC